MDLFALPHLKSSLFKSKICFCHLNTASFSKEVETLHAGDVMRVFSIISATVFLFSFAISATKAKKINCSKFDHHHIFCSVPVVVVSVIHRISKLRPHLLLSFWQKMHKSAFVICVSLIFARRTNSFFFQNWCFKCFSKTQKARETKFPFLFCSFCR